VEPVRAAIIYYSATGNVHALAHAAAEGAEKAGARVRLRKVVELAPSEAINANPAWCRHLQDTAEVAEATLADLAWADAVLFGTPTRFGNPASQLRAFIDSTGVLWREGRLADKVYSAFTSSSTAHGGQESTLLALSHTFYHWGGLIVPPGYTDPIQFQSGNPYGTSHVAGDGPPSDVVLEAARYQARRAVDIAAALKAGRSAQPRSVTREYASRDPAGTSAFGSHPSAATPQTVPGDAGKSRLERRS
jgi:NAD(P)H dehydrogenase (quinone)